ncbi:heterocycloanthracin/sonorensin family bacteriocin [Aneurinibacillus tyrosinisolvens]|uniref:heterocycloanthracin/sonorensin family bacteriocin n=1 Tax=Aneurinibacillus tyrosinisolvens TaxID=1443435 RepID=UPI00063F920D|nr:heterocycloanthracin/sonorensin family bacteriocin [Aneurinibacillus tyrosinisolvens]
MDDFQKELQGLDVSNFQAGPMIPVNTQDQYYDYTRQCGGGGGGGRCGGSGGGGQCGGGFFHCARCARSS